MIKRNSRGCNLKEVMENVEYDCIILVELFRDNSLILNADKCYLFVPTTEYKNEPMFAKMGDATILEENAVKLFGLIIDSKLTFNKHVKEICKKASQKLIAISKMANILSEYRRKLLIQSFFESQLSYCLLIWMFYDRTSNH